MISPLWRIENPTLLRFGQGSVWKWAIYLIAGGTDDKRLFGAPRIDMEVTKNLGVAPASPAAVLAFARKRTYGVTAEARQLCLLDLVGR